METNGIFKRALDTIIFCFTNRHAHYYNMALAVSYHKQLLDHNVNPNEFLIFSLIIKYESLQFIENKTKHELLNNSSYLVNVLPLIRYCPYKILVAVEDVARLSIVYVLDWLYDERKESITNVVVFSADMNLIFTIFPTRFEMNLFDKTPLFGFPLQLACSSTFASSQGLTLENKIAVSCVNISKSELYVCLTRIKKSADLVAIY